MHLYWLVNPQISDRSPSSSLTLTLENQTTKLKGGKKAELQTVQEPLLLSLGWSSLMSTAGFYKTKLSALLKDPLHNRHRAHSAVILLEPHFKHQCPR